MLFFRWKKSLTVLVLSVRSALFAATVSFNWSPNLEPDLAGYKIYYGVSPLLYTNTVPVGNVTNASVAGLQPGKRYYFALTAFNLAGLESAFSKEVSCVTAAAITVPFTYDFRSNGKVDEATNAILSGSPYWWVLSGGRLVLSNGLGSTIHGDLPAADMWRRYYATNLPVTSDYGLHPQNIFQMFLRKRLSEALAEVYVQKNADNLTNAANRKPYNGISFLLRYKDDGNHYYVGIRADGGAVIKKKREGIYQTLAFKQVLTGAYNVTNNPSVIPSGIWIGLKAIVENGNSDIPKLSFFIDVGRTGNWRFIFDTIDDPAKFGPPIMGEGFFGIRTDFIDASFDDFRIDYATNAVALASVQMAAREPPELIISGIRLGQDQVPNVTILGPAGELFILQRSGDLLEWFNLSVNEIDSSGFFQFRDDTPLAERAFYRLLWVDPQ